MVMTTNIGHSKTLARIERINILIMCSDKTSVHLAPRTRIEGNSSFFTVDVNSWQLDPLWEIRFDGEVLFSCLDTVDKVTHESLSRSYQLRS